MAAPSFAGEGEAAQVITQLMTAVASLQEQVNNLGGATGSAVESLATGVRTAQEMGAQAKSTVKTPQPARFKGNREGPKVPEWARQATTYLNAVGLGDSEAGVWHISAFLEGDAGVWWRFRRWT